MKKVLAGILIFDMLLGILCLSVGTERYAEQKSYGTYIETDTGVCGTSGEPKKIALTFDDDVIIGLSQEISYKEEVSMI